MKRLLYLALALALASCGKDAIDQQEGDLSDLLDKTGDYISNTDFTKEVTITWSPSGASVEGDSEGFISVEGGYVTANYTGTENIVYTLTGSSSDGSFKLYSEQRQTLTLRNLSLTCSSGAAINNQSHKYTFVVLEGTNSLSDANSASYAAPENEDMKGVLFSEGQLIFSGSGTLAVNAVNQQEKSGIVSDDYVRFMDGPSISITTGSGAGHGVKGKDYVEISGGTLEVNSSAVSKSCIKADNYFAMTGGVATLKSTGTGGKGLRAGDYDYDDDTHKVGDSYITGGTLTINTTGRENDDSSKGIKIGWVTKNGTGDRATVTGNAGNLIISGGNISVNCSYSEAVEAKGELTISGGSLYAYSSADDAVNCQDNMEISGGYVYAHSTQNDGLDANKNLTLSGGNVFAITTKGDPEVALDACEGYKLIINNGATVVAYGGLERGYSAEQSIYTMSCSAGAWNAMHSGNAFLGAFKVPSGISSVVVSAPSLSTGYKSVSVTGETICNGVWADDGISGGTESTLSTYSGGSSGGWPGGGGPGGGRPGR